MRYTALQVKVISGGTSVLDLNLGNSVEHIRQTLIELGYDGRMYYLKHFLVVDCIYAMFYALFYFCSILFLLYKNKIRRKRVYIFSVLPIAGMFFDSLLNISFSRNYICVVAVPSFSCRVPQFIIPKLRKI